MAQSRYAIKVPDLLPLALIQGYLLLPLTSESREIEKEIDAKLDYLAADRIWPPVMHFRHNT